MTHLYGWPLFSLHSYSVGYISLDLEWLFRQLSTIILDYTPNASGRIPCLTLPQEPRKAPLGVGWTEFFEIWRQNVPKTDNSMCEVIG